MPSSVKAEKVVNPPHKPVIRSSRILELMSESIEELNKEQKQCVTLFYLEKRSYQEIAESTGYTLMQVKSYIQNGKRNLKILLEQKLKQQAWAPADEP